MSAYGKEVPVGEALPRNVLNIPATEKHRQIKDPYVVIAYTSGENKDYVTLKASYMCR